MFSNKKKSAWKNYWWPRATVNVEFVSTQVWKLGNNSSNLKFSYNFRPDKDFRESIEYLMNG